jgi:hypothetical protein
MKEENKNKNIPPAVIEAPKKKKKNKLNNQTPEIESVSLISLNASPLAFLSPLSLLRLEDKAEAIRSRNETLTSTKFAIPTPSGKT